MKVLTKDSLIDDFAIIIEVDDLELSRIERDPYKYFRNELKNVVFSSGDNAVITTLNCKVGTAMIINKMNELLKIYKSVCWFNRDNTNFYIKRRKQCTGG